MNSRQRLDELKIDWIWNEYEYKRNGVNKNICLLELGGWQQIIQLRGDRLKLKVLFLIQ